MKITFNHCQACGFPMEKEEDFGGHNKNNKWCSSCCYENGEHKDFEILVEEMSNFLLTREGEIISEMKFNSKEEAKIFAENYIKKQPAFKK